MGGDPALVSRSITMDHSPYLVVGIAEPGFQFPLRSDVYRAAHLGAAQNKDVRSLFIVARLGRGLTIEQAQQRLNTFGSDQERIYPDSNRGIRFRLTPLREAYVGEIRPYLLLTSGLVTLVLLIACVNVANLLLSRGFGRRKELAVRSALGAGRGSLFRQLLGESMLLAAAGGTAGLALAVWWTRLLRSILRVDLPSWMMIDLGTNVLLFTLAVSVAGGLAAGLMPALSLARTDLQDAFRDGARGSSYGPAQRVVRQALVAGEIAAALALLVASGLLVQSFARLQKTDTGFRRDQTLTLRTDPPWARYNRVEQTSQFYRQALERIEALPGVEAAAANHSIPLAVNQNYGKPSITVEGQSVDEQQRNPFVNVQIVSPNYFPVMGVPILRGRGFTSNDRIGAPHVNSESLLGGLSMDLYFSNQQQFAGDTFFIVRTPQPDMAGLRTAIAGAIRQTDPEQPVFDVQPLDDLVEGTVWQRRIAGRLSLWFGALALTLAAMGTYSVLSYAVSQRTRELGIRHALGSTPRQLVGLVVREGMMVAGAGMIIGAAIAAGAAHAMAGLLYGVGPIDPAIFGTAFAVVAAVAFVACYIPARRAAKSDPLIALRNM
jgi:putative ABC transport system permease protein